MGDHCAMEFANRIAAAWAAFMKNKLALCNRHCNLQSRLKAFDAIVTPTALYGMASLTLRAEMEQKLMTTRRRMLRFIVGVRRGKEETGVEYIRRATHTSEELANKAGLRCWTHLQRSRKWNQAGKAARCPDDRWCRRILEWKPWFKCDGPTVAPRNHSPKGSQK